MLFFTHLKNFTVEYLWKILCIYLECFGSCCFNLTQRRVWKSKKKKCFWQECQGSPDSWMIFIFQHQKFIPCSSREIFKLLNTQYSKYSIFKSLNASLHTLLSFFSLNTFLSICFFTFFTFLFYVFTHHKFTKVLKTPEKLISSSKISSFSSSEFLP